VAGLKKARVALDRKILAHLALEDEAAFRQLVEIARNAQAA
jgi:ribosomal protein L20